MSSKVQTLPNDIGNANSDAGETQRKPLRFTLAPLDDTNSILLGVDTTALKNAIDKEVRQKQLSRIPSRQWVPKNLFAPAAAPYILIDGHASLSPNQTAEPCKLLSPPRVALQNDSFAVFESATRHYQSDAVAAKSLAAPCVPIHTTAADHALLFDVSATKQAACGAEPIDVLPPFVFTSNSPTLCLSSVDRSYCKSPFINTLVTTALAGETFVFSASLIGDLIEQILQRQTKSSAVTHSLRDNVTGNIANVIVEDSTASVARTCVLTDSETGLHSAELNPSATAWNTPRFEYNRLAPLVATVMANWVTDSPGVRPDDQHLSDLTASLFAMPTYTVTAVAEEAEGAHAMASNYIDPQEGIGSDEPPSEWGKSLCGIISAPPGLDSATLSRVIWRMKCVIQNTSGLPPRLIRVATSLADANASALVGENNNDCDIDVDEETPTADRVSLTSVAFAGHTDEWTALITRLKVQIARVSDKALGDWLVSMLWFVMRLCDMRSRALDCATCVAKNDRAFVDFKLGADKPQNDDDDEAFLADLFWVEPANRRVGGFALIFEPHTTDQMMQPPSTTDATGKRKQRNLTMCVIEKSLVAFGVAMHDFFDVRSKGTYTLHTSTISFELAIVHGICGYTVESIDGDARKFVRPVIASFSYTTREMVYGLFPMLSNDSGRELPIVPSEKNGRGMDRFIAHPLVADADDTLCPEVGAFFPSPSDCMSAGYDSNQVSAAVKANSRSMELACRDMDALLNHYASDDNNAIEEEQRDEEKEETVKEAVQDQHLREEQQRKKDAEAALKQKRAEERAAAKKLAKQRAAEARERNRLRKKARRDKKKAKEEGKAQRIAVPTQKEAATHAGEEGHAEKDEEEEAKRRRLEKEAEAQRAWDMAEAEDRRREQQRRDEKRRADDVRIARAAEERKEVQRLLEKQRLDAKLDAARKADRPALLPTPGAPTKATDVASAERERAHAESVDSVSAEETHDRKVPLEPASEPASESAREEPSQQQEEEAPDNVDAVADNVDEAETLPENPADAEESHFEVLEPIASAANEPHIDTEQLSESDETSTDPTLLGPADAIVPTAVPSDADAPEEPRTKVFVMPETWSVEPTNVDTQTASIDQDALYGRLWMDRACMLAHPITQDDHTCFNHRAPLTAEKTHMTSVKDSDNQFYLIFNNVYGILLAATDSMYRNTAFSNCRACGVEAVGRGEEIPTPQRLLPQLVGGDANAHLVSMSRFARRLVQHVANAARRGRQSSDAAQLERIAAHSKCMQCNDNDQQRYYFVPQSIDSLNTISARLIALCDNEKCLDRALCNLAQDTPCCRGLDVMFYENGMFAVCDVNRKAHKMLFRGDSDLSGNAASHYGFSEAQFRDFSGGVSTLDANGVRFLLPRQVAEKCYHLANAMLVGLK